MKRILKGACVVALVALAFTSCKKNENKNLTLIATAEEVEVVNDDRVYINPQNLVYFEQGDQVVLYNIVEDDNVTPYSYYGVYTARTTGSRVLFDYQSGPLVDHPDKADAFFGFYPGQRVNNGFLTQGNYGVFNIPNVQTYREINGTAVLPERSWAMAGKRDDVTTIQGEDFYFNFQNIMGALGLWLKTNGEEKVVTSIVYEDKLFNVAGDFHMKIHKVDPTEMMWLFNNYDLTNPEFVSRFNAYKSSTGYFVDGDQYGKTITLDCGEGVVINGTRKPFYIALRPLASMGGRKITVNFADGSKAVIDDDINRRIAPGQIRNREENVSLHMVP